MAALLGAQGCGWLALRRTVWCRDKWTSSTGNLPTKRHDITETLLKSELNTKQSINKSLFSVLTLFKEIFWLGRITKRRYRRLCCLFFFQLPLKRYESNESCGDRHLRNVSTRSACAVRADCSGRHIPS